MSCFVCIVLSCPYIFLVLLLSLLASGLFPRVVLFVLWYLLFFFVLTSSSVPPQSYHCFLVVADFLLTFPVEFSIQFWSLFLCSFGKPHFSHKLSSLLHRLIRLIPWCHSLGYVLINRLFFSVSTLTLFQSWFLRNGNQAIMPLKISTLFFLFVLVFVLCGLAVWGGPISACSAVSHL